MEHSDLHILLSFRVMPCFNQGQYVDDAINSVINQSFKDIEIVLIEGALRIILLGSMFVKKLSKYKKDNQ